MTKARSHFISFRVTDDEFRQLKLACDLEGSRSLSAFARKVMLSTHDTNGENSRDRIAALNERISLLEVTLSRLTHSLESPTVSASEK
jgi:hypothetical protein